MDLLPWKLRVLMILIDDNDTITYISATIFSSTDPVYGASTFDPGDNLTFVNIDNETDLAIGSFFRSLDVSENGSSGNFYFKLNNNPDQITNTFH